MEDVKKVQGGSQKLETKVNIVVVLICNVQNLFLYSKKYGRVLYEK